jgi:methyl-accepting chemotaxis protein
LIGAAGMGAILVVEQPIERLATLVTVAVGWALILWRLESMFHAKVEQVAEVERGLIKLHDEFHAVLDQFIGTFNDQFTKSKGELDQLRRLLGDAVARLTDAFTALKSQAQTQQELMEGLTGHSTVESAAAVAHREGEEPGSGLATPAGRMAGAATEAKVELSDWVEDLWRLKGELDTTIGEAVTALQFEDISTQLVTHVLDRVEYLETLLAGVDKIEAGFDTAMKSAEEVTTLYRYRLDKMGEALAAASLLIERTEHVAVRQEKMSAGEIELF